MSSIFDGFTCDIFISYRQKDNNYDGWVTEFVANLKKELQATLKEDVSIYFDANPHDGLLETHQVGASLEGKLKCLIFIPIISQTYCDPKCFAWEYEFRAFNQLAKSDAFGRDIRLANGNVISRILPVKIHDLDEDDKKLFEGELGGPMRSIDFIYKSAGVNRPLRTTEDHPQDNLNKTYYRDQINKVANSIKEIIGGMKKSEGKAPEETKAGQKSFSNKLPVPGNSGRKWIAAGSIAVLLLAVMAYFLVLPKFSVLKDPGTSGVAVLPFRNFTGSEELNYYGVGMASEIRTKLSMSKLFRSISSLQATLTYTDTKKTPKEIGAELNVDYLLSGLYQKANDKIRVEVELIDAATGHAVWTLPFESELADIFLVQAKIANLVLKQFSAASTALSDDKAPTKSLEAYAHYTRGLEIYSMSGRDAFSFDVAFEPAIAEFEKGIQLDSAFMECWVGLVTVETFVLINEPPNAERKSKIQREVDYVNRHFEDSWQKKLIQGLYAYRILHRYEEAISFFEQVLLEEPDNVIAMVPLSGIYRRQLKHRQAAKYALDAVSISPGQGYNLANLGNTLDGLGDEMNSTRVFIGAWRIERNKRSAVRALFHAMVSNFPLEDVPEELKRDAGNHWHLINKLKSRNWEEVKRIALIEKDYKWIECAYWSLGKMDSVSYWAEIAQKAESGSFFHGLFSRDRDKAFRFIETIYDGESADDLENMSFKLIDQLFVHMLFGEYREATAKLIQLNQQYPDFNRYNGFNNPVYDKMKKEYPPFQEALNNLKRKPVLDIGNSIKY